MSDLFDFFVDLFLWAPRKIWSLFIDGLIALFQTIPDPCCIVEGIALFQWLAAAMSSGGVFHWLAWIFELAQFEFGLRVVLCTLLARWLLRRIPLIG